jgi:hypothetical protein
MIMGGWNGMDGSLAHLQRLEQQRLGGVHDFDVVLVGARGEIMLTISSTGLTLDWVT